MILRSTEAKVAAFILGAPVGFGAFYGYFAGRLRLSGSQSVFWYFVSRVASVVLMLPVMFTPGLSAPPGAFVFGVVSATLLTFWTKLFEATPFSEKTRGCASGYGAQATSGSLLEGS